MVSTMYPLQTHTHTYSTADGHKDIGIVGVVGDLHQGGEGKVKVAETHPKVLGDKDT